MVHHSFENAARNKLLGDARKCRAQAVPLHCGSGLFIDPGECLASIDDGEYGLVGLSVHAVSFHDLQSLSGQQQLVVAAIFCVAQNDLATLSIDIADLDRWIVMTFAAMDFPATAARKKLESIVVTRDF